MMNGEATVTHTLYHSSSVILVSLFVIWVFFLDHRSHFGCQKKRSRNANKIIFRCGTTGSSPSRRGVIQGGPAPARQFFSHLLQLLGRHGPRIVRIESEIHLVKMISQALEHAA